MTCLEYKNRIEKIFNVKLKKDEKGNKVPFDQTYVYSIYYFIGVDRFRFTRLQLSEELGYKNPNKASGYCKNHWLKIEKKPLYNYVYLKALQELELEINNVEILKIKSKDPIITEIINLSETDRLDLYKYKIIPHLKMLKSKVTNQDLIDIQYQTRGKQIKI